MTYGIGCHDNFRRAVPFARCDSCGETVDLPLPEGWISDGPPERCEHTCPDCHCRACGCPHEKSDGCYRDA